MAALIIIRGLHWFQDTAKENNGSIHKNVYVQILEVLVQSKFELAYSTSHQGDLNLCLVTVLKAAVVLLNH